MVDAVDQIAKVLPIFADTTRTSESLVSTVADDRIPEGLRNSTLASVAGKLRAIGLPADTITAALRVENQRRCDPMLADAEVQQIAASIARYDTTAIPKPLIAYKLGEFLRHKFPPRRTVLERNGVPFLRNGGLGEIVATRGLGKTFLGDTLLLLAASGTSALGFSASRPVRCLDIDGEVDSEEKQDRNRFLCNVLRLDPEPLDLTVVGADWQDGALQRLDTRAGQLAVEPLVDQADLIKLDNRSCLFDAEGETKGEVWELAAEWLLSLRRRGKSVILCHHTNRQGSARGHSRAEDLLNWVLLLSKPEDWKPDQGCRFMASFEKMRGPALAAVPFAAHLRPDGWHLENENTDGRISTADKLVDYVRLSHGAGEPVRSGSRAIAAVKVKKDVGLKTWKELLAKGIVAALPDKAGFYVP